VKSSIVDGPNGFSRSNVINSFDEKDLKILALGKKLITKLRHFALKTSNFYNIQIDNYEISRFKNSINNIGCK